MNEYSHNLGRRVELKEKLTRSKIAVGSHLESLRLLLDPIADPLELDVETIVKLAVILAERVSEGRETAASIKAIESIIGK